MGQIDIKLWALLIAAGIAFGGFALRAEQAQKQSRSNQEQIQILTDIHTTQQAAEQAKIELRRKLCAEGKLEGADCVLPEEDEE